MSQIPPVLAWHMTNGGHNQHERSMAKHSLRALREMVELCIASGATVQEIKEEVLAEMQAQDSKGAFNQPPTVDGIAKEWADVAICMLIIEGYGGFQSFRYVDQKMEVNFHRQWAADEFGVLWRPEVLEARRAEK